MPNLMSRVKLTKLKDHSTADTSGVNSDSVDMAGYDSVVFFTSFGTAAANNTINVETSSDDGSSDSFTDLEDTEVVSGTSDEDVFLEIIKPRERYLRLVADRGTSTTLESIWCIQRPARSAPVDNTISGTMTGEIHVSPAEGVK